MRIGHRSRGGGGTGIMPVILQKFYHPAEVRLIRKIPPLPRSGPAWLRLDASAAQPSQDLCRSGEVTSQCLCHTPSVARATHRPREL